MSEGKPILKGLADAIYAAIEHRMNRRPHRCWRQIMGVCYDCGKDVNRD